MFHRNISETIFKFGVTERYLRISAQKGQKSGSSGLLTITCAGINFSFRSSRRRIDSRIEGPVLIISQEGIEIESISHGGSLSCMAVRAMAIEPRASLSVIDSS